MNAKYFKQLPDQEYVFKNFFTCGKNEGLCCADCGTYITRVVQLYGKADHQVYNLGTTCCDKISKDRSVFLTPQSVQRKKIFMAEFKKIEKSIKDLEALADELGGEKLKFYDLHWSIYNSIDASVFIFCGSNYLIHINIDFCQRCWSALKDLFADYAPVTDYSELYKLQWSNDTLLAFRDREDREWKKSREGWNDDEGVWYKFFKANYPDSFGSWKHNQGELWETVSKYKSGVHVF